MTCTLFADDELDQFRSVQERAGPLAFMREMAARAEQRTAEIGNKLLDQQLTDNMIQELREHTGQGQHAPRPQDSHKVKDNINQDVRIPTGAEVSHISSRT